MTAKTTTIACAAIAIGGLLGAAPASQARDASASCVGIITSYEASQLAAGSVGIEVSGLARSGPGLGAAVVSPLAREHGPSCAR